LNIFRIYFYDFGSSGQPVLSIISNQSIFARNCIMHVIVIERIIATIKSKNYENRRNIPFHAIWITFTVIFL